MKRIILSVLLLASLVLGPGSARATEVGTSRRSASVDILDPTAIAW